MPFTKYFCKNGYTSNIGTVEITITALDIFDDVLNKEKLNKADLELIIEKILVYENRIEIKLKADIDVLLKTGEISEDGQWPPLQKNDEPSGLF